MPGRPTDEEIAVCLRVLAALHHVPPDDPDFMRVEHAAARLRKERKKQQRRARRGARRAADRAVRREAARRRPGEEAAPAAVAEMRRARACYICKKPYRVVSERWDQHCPACAAEEASRRARSADLAGRSALLTGGRIKIGFETALRLLRWGARVEVTTRFPADAARRYAEQADFESWRERLTIHALDLRRLPAVVALAESLAARPEPFDIVIHNAAQTVSRPRAHHAALYAREGEPLPKALTEIVSGRRDGTDRARAGAVAAAALARSDPAARALFVEAQALLEPESGLSTDFRPVNSWVRPLGEVGPIEAVEVHVVNAIAPFILTNRLLPSMRASPFADRYIVNVSAMEGKFGRRVKGEMHPHTNMAKAALNMLTRTSAEQLAEEGIFMCSVDTGWVTDEAPVVKQDLEFRPPLDSVDGAVRVLDPILRGIVDGRPIHGCFLKDYVVTEW